MKKISLFLLTIISSILFLIVMFVYEGLAYYAYHLYSGELSTQEFIIKYYSTFMEIEPVIKQSLLVSTILLFGCTVSNNILKLTNITKKLKTRLYLSALSVLFVLITLLLIMINYSNIMLYQITSALMMLLLIIWIATIITDYIKTKNNTTSIMSRVIIFALGLMLVITNTSKVINDYKVNSSLVNSIEYRIDILNKQMVNADDASKEVLQSLIDNFEEDKLPIYTTSLYIGKSVFVFYGDIEVDMFLSAEEKVVMLEDRISVLENYLYTEDVYDLYQINYGLYLGGDSSKIITLVLIILSIITLKLFPLTREKNEPVTSDATEYIKIKLASNSITEEECEALLRRIW